MNTTINNCDDEIRKYYRDKIKELKKNGAVGVLLPTRDKDIKIFKEVFGKFLKRCLMEEKIKQIIEEAEDIYRTPGDPDAVYDAYLYLLNSLEDLLEIQDK